MLAELQNHQAIYEVAKIRGSSRRYSQDFNDGCRCCNAQGGAAQEGQGEGQGQGQGGPQATASEEASCVMSSVFS